MGRSPNTIKTWLSAATWAVSTGIARPNVARFFSRYVKGAENAWDDKKDLWGSVAAVQTMAANAQNPTEWAVVAPAVFSTVVGYKGEKRRVSKSEAWVVSGARSRFGTKRSTVGRLQEGRDSGQFVGSDSSIGGRSKNWDEAPMIRYYGDLGSWSGSWLKCWQGPHGKMSRGMDGSNVPAAHLEM